MYFPNANATSEGTRTMDTSKRMITLILLVLAGGMFLSAVAPALAQPGTVLAHEKISDSDGGSTGWLDDSDLFGYSVASLGDLDGDGIDDLAVGAILDDDGGPDHGAVWIHFLNADGSVKSRQKISDTEGNFTGEHGPSSAPLRYAPSLRFSPFGWKKTHGPTSRPRSYAPSERTFPFSLQKAQGPTRR